MIIAGMGRFGQVVNRMLPGLGHRTVVLDSQPEMVERMRGLGIEAFYGDVDAAGAARRRRHRRGARRWCWRSTTPEARCGWPATSRRRHPELAIIARARDRHHVYALHAAGAATACARSSTARCTRASSRWRRSGYERGGGRGDRAGVPPRTTGRCSRSSRRSGDPTSRRSGTPPTSPRSASSTRRSTAGAERPASRRRRRRTRVARRRLGRGLRAAASALRCSIRRP